MTKRHKRKNKKKKFYKRISFYLLITPILIISIISVLAYQKYNPIIEVYVDEGYSISKTVQKEQFTQTLPTRVFDSNNNVIKELNTYANYQVNVDNVNPLLKKGFVAVEDKRFYQHQGVDLYSTLRAIVSTLLGKGTQGGSTITQQLVKNKVLKNQEQTYSRKITEMVIAQDLNDKLSKDEVLISYLNDSWFGRGATGVGAASRVYFDKNQKDLTVREASVIIGLTNNPSLYDPISHPEEALKKSNITLKTMLDNNVISLSQYKTAIKEKIVTKQGFIENSKEYTDNYAVSYAITQSAKELLKEEGFEFKYSFKTEEEYNKWHNNYVTELNKEIDKITSGGYDIKTNINMDLQNNLQQQVNQSLSISGEINPDTGKPNLQAAVTVIDNNTGEVVSSIGGRGTEDSSLNRAYQSFRQPGSTEKVLLGYGPAFDKGILLPQSSILDAQIPEYPSVRDWFGGWYNQNFTVRSALEQSLNTPAIRASMMTGPIEDNLKYLEKMQFSQLHPSDNTEVSVIGGLTVGVSTTEQAAAYATIANQGKYRTPTNVTEITNRYNNKTIDVKNKPSIPVYKPSTSYMLLDMMKTSAQGITVEKGTLADNYPKDLQAGKTGSTDEYKDVWYVSTNAYYTTAIWVGNDNSQPLAQVYQNQAMKISKLVNTQLLQGKEPKDFTMPDSLSKRGTSFDVIKDDSIPTQQKDEKKYSAELTSKHNNSSNKNKERIESEDYRIIFGLSKEEEMSREKNAKESIDSIQNKITENGSNDEIISKISKAKVLINKVKNRKTQTELLNKVVEFESLYNKNKETSEQKNRQIEEETKNQKIENKKSELKETQEKTIENLESELEKQKQAVINSSTTTLKEEVDKLDSIIKELNKNGKETPWYNIITDGKTVILEEGDYPEIKKE